MVVSLGVLSGCAILEGPPIDRPERPTIAIPSPEPDQPIEFVPDGTAEDNLPIFHETLSAVAASESALEGRLLVDELVGVGFSPDLMQVSFDRTPTDLVVDNLYVSARFGTECLVGQVDTTTRELFVDIAPAVGPGDELCLIGNTRPIDW